MLRKFRIDCPEQLIALRGCAKTAEDCKAIRSHASAWTIGRMRNGAACKWNGRIWAEFFANGTAERRARIKRIDAQGNERVVGELKYNLGLQCCTGTLKREV